MDDLKVPAEKAIAMEKAEEEVAVVNSQFNMGLLTEEERKSRVIEIWNRTKNSISESVKGNIDKEGTAYTLVHSKARGSESVLVQMMGMKGLVAGPTGETIELPVKSSFKEGFNVLEYFISTHGARKGMADTALRTATAGYLTRRLVDVSQDIIVREDDCGDTEGAYIYKEDSDRIGQSFATRVEGRVLVEDAINPATKEVIVKAGTIVTKEEGKAVEAANVEKVKIRNVVTCKTKRGICRKCYGMDLGRNELINIGQAVGIVAAQAIGEPGTQLTMRTFHIGGVAGSDITQGLPRVEEIFEARPPKGESLISEVNGTVVDIINENKKTVTVKIENTEGEMVEYQVPSESTIVVGKGQLVGVGTQLNEGHIDLKKLYGTMGREAIHRYITREIQEIYAAQGEGINDKHIEVVIRQMLSRVKIENPGDTDLLPGDIVEVDQFREANEQARKDKQMEATGETLLMGITKVALSTESFLSSASFQETARVLINAAVTGKDDGLRGLKENVIIGRLIPAGTGYRK
jgi:DNA-directed RNA polymerase subunit beta'